MMQTSINQSIHPISILCQRITVGHSALVPPFCTRSSLLACLEDNLDALQCSYRLLMWWWCWWCCCSCILYCKPEASVTSSAVTWPTHSIQIHDEGKTKTKTDRQAGIALDETKIVSHISHFYSTFCFCNTVQCPHLRQFALWQFFGWLNSVHRVWLIIRSVYMDSQSLWSSKIERGTFTTEDVR